MKISILNPIGYCSGVKNAIFIAEKARKENPDKDIYVLGKLVHNEFIIRHLNNLKIHTIFEKNTSLTELIKQIPNDSIVVFTAHGHQKSLDEIANKKNLKIYDSVCPKVKHNMDNIQGFVSKDNDVIFIGIKDHPETEASVSLGEKVHLFDINSSFDYSSITSESPFITNQTTLNFMELERIHNEIKSHFPKSIFSNEICKATRERQENISKLGDDVDVVFVIGDKASSNTNRLVEISTISNKKAKTYLISDENDVSIEKIENKKHLVIASGASTPDITIQSVINKINELIK